MIRKPFVGAFLLTVSGLVWAYEEPTHMELSLQSVRNSALAHEVNLLDSLGVKPYALKQRFPDSNGSLSTIEELIQFGSRHEDSWPRSLNHFFDPYYNRPLTVGGFAVGKKSPDWILNEAGNIQNQQFSYRMAQFYFVQALSGASQYERDRYWGLMFQTLGHVIHHIQDMAQPEHTRNDQHLSQPVPLDRSLYERYTRLNPGKWTPLLPGSGSNIEFGTARSFWADSGGRGLADYTNRNFVSKDSNFRYRDNALASNEEYPAPVPSGVKTWPLDAPELGIPNASGLCAKLLSDPKVGAPPGTECEIDLIQSVVLDGYTGTTAVNERASSFSAFNQYQTEVENRRGLFTLNFLNFDAGYRFLIPQAVNYSTGLIDHFFRGKIELVGPARVRDGNIVLTIKNVSEGNHHFSNGVFSVFYDSIGGQRKRIFVVSGKEVHHIPVNSTFTVVVGPIPNDFDPLGQNPLTLIFEGMVGQENAVAGLVVGEEDAPVRGLITHHPGVGARLISRDNDVWKLYQGSFAFGGNIDWKGWYLDGQPTRVLSWFGPTSRYFGFGLPGSSIPFQRNIFQDGKAYATAPGAVYGAAISKDDTGKEWLIAICYDGSGETVYKRPNTFSLSSNLFDPTTSPEGWQKIAHFPLPLGSYNQDRAWFFNGTGTEAQTMRRSPSYFANESRTQFGQTRLKMVINNNESATITDLGNGLIDSNTILNRTLACPSGGNGYATATFSGGAHGESVVAVDYVDHKEVLATLSVESTFFGNNFTETDYSTYGISQESYDDMVRKTLRFGEIEIIAESEINTHRSINDSRSGVSINLDESHNFINILYMDLRNNVLLYKQDGKGYAYSRTGSAVDAYRLSSGAYGYSQTTYKITNSIGPLRYGLKHADWAEQFYVGNLISNSTQHAGGYPYPEFYCGGGTPGIGAPGSRTDSASHTYVASFREHFYSPQSGAAVEPDRLIGGVAVDRYGNLMASFQYPLEDRLTKRIFNYLTGGDPALLFDINTNETYFFSVSPN